MPLIEHALTRGGPGQADRVNLETECSKLVPDGLTVSDVIATEAVLGQCIINILKYRKQKQ